MNLGGRLLAVAALAAALSLAAGTAAAVDISPMPGKTFEVLTTDASGNAQDLFPPGEDVVFAVRFGLMMSEVKSYPVIITLVVGPPGSSQQTTELFNGKLEEGFWQATQAVKVQSAWGPEAPYKVIMKVRIFNRSVAGTDSFYIYYTAEGTFKVGYR